MERAGELDDRARSRPGNGPRAQLAWAALGGSRDCGASRFEQVNEPFSMPHRLIAAPPRHA
ncbi:hypothetical protein CKO40_11035 [Halochromatium glycolicum]|uniref:Uncharacterized protein n=1 Tax=Halochromatium glycolicum TaxID=85075 RepID=A0AAJ0U4G9_9GAMM|nr:hypothetical protein [Halochromatium glycolicum]